MRVFSFVSILLFLLVLLPSNGHTGVSDASKAALVSVPASFEVAAPPAKVWKLVTSADGFGALTGFQIDAADRSTTLDKIGANVGAKIWTDKGRLVVTHAIPEKELRVTWEPEKGNYLCGKTVILKAAATGTAISYLDRYTDDQPAASVDKTAKQVVEETKAAIEKFKAMAAAK